MPTGYRHGGVGEYTGGDPKDATIAWKALDYEYRELGNQHLLQDVARFIRMKPTSWSAVISEFRKQHSDQMGIWLTRTKRDADELYGEYGSLEKHQYEKKNIISDLGSDGIFVLLGTTLSDLDTGYMDTDNNWVFYDASKKTKNAAPNKTKKKPTTTLGSMR